jgi:hypothetical protein
MLFHMRTAEWLHLAMYEYFSKEYQNSKMNIIIIVWEYLVDIRREAWLIHFWEYINGKLFAVLSALAVRLTIFFYEKRRKTLCKH